jgi:hypothetical protein
MAGANDMGGELVGYYGRPNSNNTGQKEVICSHLFTSPAAPKHTAAVPTGIPGCGRWCVPHVIRHSAVGARFHAACVGFRPWDLSNFGVLVSAYIWMIWIVCSNLGVASAMYRLHSNCISVPPPSRHICMQVLLPESRLHNILKGFILCFTSSPKHPMLFLPMF